MIEKHIDIKTADGMADCIVMHPDSGGPFPAVIYLPDIRGIRPVFMDMARKLAGHGYMVLMPNLFYRLAPAPVIDPGLVWGSEPAMKRFGELFGAVTPDGLKRDHAAFLDYLKTVSEAAAGPVAIAGYCMGGTAAFRVAGDFGDRIAAAASFHGGRLASDAPDSPHLNAGHVRARLYFGHAADDASMTDEMIAQLNAALDAAHVTYETDHYSAKHGYAVKDNPAYDAEAEERHWKRLFELLAKVFPKH
jgi:carboxymethylenebutenolidase